MIVVPHHAPPARRWLAHLLRAAEGAVLPGEPFDDEFPFEEAAVLRGAVRERVAPLIHRASSEHRLGDPLPRDFRSECERLYYGTLRKNAVALEVGEALLHSLASEGIEAAPLKGWAFTSGPAPLYADPGVRPMDDLDLIVRPEEREKAGAALARCGFALATGGAAALRGGHEVAFHRELAGVHLFVELHWAWAGPESLMREFAVAGDRFLDELCEPTREGFRRPTWTGALLFAAVHAARHALSRWIWLVDVHRLLLRRELSWEEVAEAAVRWRVRRPLYAALAATRELLRTPVPKELLAALAPGPLRRRLLHRSLAASALGARDRAAWTAKALLGETWWDVARTAAWAAAPGDAWWEARGLRATRTRRIAHPLRVLRPPAGGSEWTS